MRVPALSPQSPVSAGFLTLHIRETLRRQREEANCIADWRGSGLTNVMDKESRATIDIKPLCRKKFAMAGFCYHSLSRAFLLHSIAHLASSMMIALHASNSICLLLRVALHIYNLLGPRDHHKDGVWQRSFSSAVAFKRQSWGFQERG
jgi:hypothetical protein